LVHAPFFQIFTYCHFHHHGEKKQINEVPSFRKHASPFGVSCRRRDLFFLPPGKQIRLLPHLNLDIKMISIRRCIRRGINVRSSSSSVGSSIALRLSNRSPDHSRSWLILHGAHPTRTHTPAHHGFLLTGAKQLGPTIHQIGNQINQESQHVFL
jgi:hypothetical protein